MKVSHIVVPTDFTKHSMQALELAVDMRGRLGATVTLLHVVPPVPPVAPEAGVLYGGRSVEIGMAKDASAWLERIIEERADPMIQRAVLIGDPGPTIVEFAQKLPDCTIAMATHGRRGLPRFFLGSTTEDVLRAATCPVLTVRTLPRAVHAAVQPALYDPADVLDPRD